MKNFVNRHCPLFSSENVKENKKAKMQVFRDYTDLVTCRLEPFIQDEMQLQTMEDLAGLMQEHAN